MNLLIALGALLALSLLLYSMWLDDNRHAGCVCAPEEDPSFVWYPIRWGLVSVEAMVLLSNTLYFTGEVSRLDISYLKDASTVALGITYAATLINPKWSITILLETIRSKHRARNG